MPPTLTSESERDAKAAFAGASRYAPVAVLFCRPDSIYKTLPGCDVWDAQRDARNWQGGCPVVMHPPCRLWGRLRHLSSAPDSERSLALWSVCIVRIWGGVIEHPADSTLWPVAQLPAPGNRDAWGGWTLAAPQQWWGHNAEKRTRFYVVGCEPKNIPQVPLTIGDAARVVSNGGTNHILRGEPGWRPEITRKERDATPPQLASWLVELARRCKGHNTELSSGGPADKPTTNRAGCPPSAEVTR